MYNLYEFENRPGYMVYHQILNLRLVSKMHIQIVSEISPSLLGSKTIRDAFNGITRTYLFLNPTLGKIFQFQE